MALVQHVQRGADRAIGVLVFGRDRGRVARQINKHDAFVKNHLQGLSYRRHFFGMSLELL